MDIESFEYMQVNVPRLPKAVIGNNIIVEASGTIIWGQPKTMKSVLGVQMAACISSGTPWLREPTSELTTLYIQTEIPKPYFHHRIVQMGQNIVVKPKTLFFSSAFNIKLDQQKGQQEILAGVNKIKPNVIILDPFYKLLSSQREDNIQVGLEFLDLLKSLNITVILIHHARKSNRDGNGDQGGNEIRGPLLEQWADSLIRVSGNLDSDVRILDFELRHSTKSVPPMALTLDRSKLWFVRQI